MPRKTKLKKSQKRKRVIPKIDARKRKPTPGIWLALGPHNQLGGFFSDFIPSKRT